MPRSSLPTRIRARLADLTGLFSFLRNRRSLGLAILVAFLLVLTIVLYVLQSSTVAPYIYPLF